MNKILFALGIVLPCVYISGLTGYSLETQWPLLWLLLPLLLLGTKIRPTPAHAAGAVLLAWALLSLLWTPVWYSGAEAALKIGVLAFAFLLGAERDDRWLLQGLAIGLGINSAVAVAQSFGMHWPELVSGIPAGLLYNANALAEPAAIVALVLIVDRAWLWALPLAPAILISGSRSGLLILGVGFCAWLWQRSKILAIALLAACAILGATHFDKIPSTAQRVAIWQDTAQGLSVLGHGLGSFGVLYPRFATRINTTRERPYHAHSDFLEVTFELGILGLILFMAFGSTCFAWAGPRERITLTACCAIALVDFPLFVPTTAFVVAWMAGRGAGGWRERSVEWSDSGSTVAASDEVRGLLWPNRS